MEVNRKGGGREDNKRWRSAPWNAGCSSWCRKYFWEGQALSHDGVSDGVSEGLYSTWGSDFVSRHRRALGLVIPALVVHFAWWSLMASHQLFHLFITKYQMTVTMVFGSIIAGMTSEGGGAVAFPVMTLLLNLSPTIARDFSVMIQAIGMTGAMFAIIFMNIQIEWYAIVLGSLGGIIGLILGLEHLDMLIRPDWKKMIFVSIWFSFAFALFLLNWYHKRRTYRVIPRFSAWKGAVLVLAGVVGGGFSSIAGSGIDICMFSVLTLLFRVTEKTATPTSVVMMAVNTCVAAYWRGVVMGDVDIVTYEYVAVCAPVVVIGAPLGSVLGSHFHRQVLAALVYILDTVALVTAFILVKQTPVLAGVSVAMILVGFLFFFILTKLGHFLMQKQTEVEERERREKLERLQSKGNVNDGYDSIGEIVTLAHF